MNLPPYRALLEQFRREHVTISTIGVGAAFINNDSTMPRPNPCIVPKKPESLFPLL